MKIGLAQMNIEWENKKKNLLNAEKMIQDAVRENIECLLFPEMSLTGFSMNIDVIGEKRVKLETIAKFREFSIKYQIYLGIGYVEKEEKKGLNRYAIINPRGEVLGDYVKIHPFSYGEESLFYKGGESLVATNIEDIILAPCICYDLRFPEIFQAASKTAHCIVVAANWPMERREHWIALLKARAIENQCYIAGVNRVGEGNGIKYSGDSMIVDPYGEILSSAIRGEGIVSAKIEKRTVDSYRKNFRLKEDRKEELYVKLFEVPH